MISTPTTAPVSVPPPVSQTEGFLWIDQLSEEMLLTVQAFQRLHAALQNRMIGK
jgi:hypothetical protein